MFSKIKMLLFIFGLCFVLYGCGSRKPHQPPPIARPQPNKIIDPDSMLLIAAMQNYIAQVKAPPQTRYRFTRVDLDSDGRRDGLVLTTGPINPWCDLHGCELLVFKARNDGFDLNSTIHQVRGPLTVSWYKSQGWRNIVVRLDGRWEDKREVSLKFNGRKYPENPVAVPDKAPCCKVPGQVVFP